MDTTRWAAPEEQIFSFLTPKGIVFLGCQDDLVLVQPSIVRAYVMYTLIPIFVTLSAPFVGSFLANFAARWSVGQQVMRGRSRCRMCNTSLGMMDLVPLISWLCLRGRCRTCHGQISFYYPAVEFATLGVAIWTVLSVNDALILPTFCFGCILLTLAIVDGQTYLLPDIMTFGLIPLGLIFCIATVPDTILDHIIGAAAGFGAFAAVMVLYERVRGRAGLGLGDAKLLAGLGAWVSWQELPEVIVLAAFGGLVFVVFRRFVLGVPVGSTNRIAFGPFLCFAGWLVLLYGDTTSSWG